MVHISALCCTLAFLVSTLSAQQPSQPPLGVGWRVQGAWHLAGGAASLRAGDPIPPSSLLQPDSQTAAHSITVLLPDGQSVLYECFTSEQCARGFQVPPLYRRPGAFALGMLARVRAALLNQQPSPANVSQPVSSRPLQEALVVFDRGRRVRVAGLAGTMSNGRYTVSLRQIHAAQPRPVRFDFDKNGPFIDLPIPAPGLYDLTIFDALHRPRIDLFVAALTPARAAALMPSFQRAQALLVQWNTDFQNWPVHIFQRAYIESLCLGIRPHPARALPFAASPARRPNVTAEPAFSPRPGLFHGNVDVILRCSTPGATIHYTIDTAEPVASSPVYTAPIVVQGSTVTVKAYARAPGKKDSPVVTGIFRIPE